MNITLIDCDPIAYICGYSYRDSDHQYMLEKVDELVSNVLNATQADTYLGFLGGQGNFRHAVATTKPYKGNRSKEQPEWLQQWKTPICEHLVKEWGMQVVDGIEADDALSITHAHYSAEHQVTIASPDKDMKQVAGLHFDFKKWEHSFWTEEESSKHFWTSVLCGDGIDNIPGLVGCGSKTAEKILATAVGQSYEQAVRTAYALKGCPEEYFLEQYTLLKMLTQPAYGFTVPHPIPVPLFDLLAEKKVYTAPTPVSTNTNYLSSLGVD